MKYYSPCAQCPRNCKVDRTSKKGFCREQASVRIASACLHFGEEPLVTVRGGSGTIFFSGCTLRCAFCQNYQISQNGMGREVVRDEFVNICMRLQEAGAENINLVTGSHNIPLIAEYLEAARDAGCTIPYCWNSSAYESIEMLELLRPLVSIWLPDLKTLDDALSEKLFDAKDYPRVAKEAVSWMIENFPLAICGASASESSSACRNVLPSENSLAGGAPVANETQVANVSEKIMRGVIVRHLFLPGHFAETCDVLDWLKNNADGRAIISLMSQYTPVPFAEDASALVTRRKKLSVLENRLVSPEEDADIRDLIEAYDFEYLFYQELTDDTSWLPDFNREQPFSHKLAKPIWHWKNN